MKHSILTLGGTAVVAILMVSSLVWLLGLTPSAAQTAGAILYVAPTGANSGNCTNSATPCATVQYAVDQANDGAEIWVAAGTYTGVTVREGITQSVYLTKPLTIRGGYAADFNEPPDPAANPTILDADGLGRVFYVRETNNVIIDGFHLQAGDATGLGGINDYRDQGGNLFVLTSTVTFSQNHIAYGTAYEGGGLTSYSSNLTFTANTFTSNEATFLGGGIALLHGYVTLNNNLIMNNTAGTGGGGIWTVVNGEMTSNDVLSNTAGLRGGGLFMEAGEMQLTNNLIAYNTTCCDFGNSAGGGGLYVRNTRATVENNTIHSNNTHAFGGGIRVETSPAIIRNNLIFSNSTENDGGGVNIFLHNNFGVIASPTLDGNIIMDNVADRGGGGVAIVLSDPTLVNNLIVKNEAGESGSGIHIFASMPTLSHTTLVSNEGPSGQGVSASSAIVTFTNTIVVDHSVGISISNETTVTMQATLWGTDAWANGSDWFNNGSLITAMNLHGDPAFVNPAAGDYHLSEASAARDAGVNAGVYHDIDSQLRPMGAGYDIGADEFFIDLPHHLYLPLARFD